MSRRNSPVVFVATLIVAATPILGLPPCTQQAAQSICADFCSLEHSTSCNGAWLNGCEIEFECAGVTGIFTNPCTCSGCFLSGTEITMADGTVRMIEDIQVGDLILAYDEATGEMKEDKVVAVHEPVQWDHYLVVNGHLKLTPPHEVLSGGEWVEIGKLKVGDMLTHANGSALPIDSMERVESLVTVYNFAVNPFETYVANGVIVHNKPPGPHELD